MRLETQHQVTQHTTRAVLETLSTCFANSSSLVCFFQEWQEHFLRLVKFLRQRYELSTVHKEAAVCLALSADRVHVGGLRGQSAGAERCSLVSLQLAESRALGGDTGKKAARQAE